MNNFRSADQASHKYIIQTGCWHKCACVLCCVCIDCKLTFLPPNDTRMSLACCMYVCDQISNGTARAARETEENSLSLVAPRSQESVLKQHTVKSIISQLRIDYNDNGQLSIQRDIPYQHAILGGKIQLYAPVQSKSIQDIIPVLLDTPGTALSCAHAQKQRKLSSSAYDIAGLVVWKKLLAGGLKFMRYFFLRFPPRALIGRRAPMRTQNAARESAEIVLQNSIRWLCASEIHQIECGFGHAPVRIRQKQDAGSAVNCGGCPVEWQSSTVVAARWNLLFIDSNKSA